MVLFDGTAGQRLNLGMSSITGANSGVFIYSPDGSLVTSVGSVPVPGWNIEAGPLTVTGTYAIVIVPATSSTVAMTLTLSADHRVLDGALAARLLGEIVRRIENPFSTVL